MGDSDPRLRFGLLLKPPPRFDHFGGPPIRDDPLFTLLSPRNPGASVVNALDKLVDLRVRQRLP
jgi:hypothetical protein